MNNISKSKIAVGYVLLLAVLFFSLFFVYREMGHLLSSEKNDFLKTDSLIVLLQKKDSNTVSYYTRLAKRMKGSYRLVKWNRYLLWKIARYSVKECNAK